ncbi:MAG: dephospho-CoA kinase [Anaerolineales bacterium]|nr:dephospho-CoA kinase [Anaerolineales bacterium]
MSEQTKTITQTGKVVVGITGNIATGKSAITRLARDNGALTIDADHVVHEIMDTDANMQAAIAVAFGNEVRLPDGRINRRTLGKIAFNDRSALQDLEQIIHPAVRQEIAKRIHDTDKKIIFIEAIKLIEGPLVDVCHQVWVTRCPKQRQLERLMICRGMDAETATKQIDIQAPQEEKVARADVVIDTAGLMRETEAQFEMAWGRLPAPADASPITLDLPVDGAAPTTLPAEGTPTKPAEPAKKAEDSSLKRPIPTSLKKKLGRTMPGKPKPATTPPPAAATSAPTPKPEPVQPPPQTAKAPTPTSTDVKVEVRRARPSDIPSILLLIHRATEGALRLKRADMLMALSERSYFIGQIGTDIQAVVGWNIENLVSRIDQIYFHPAEAISTVGKAIVESIEQSADQHICEIIVAFLPQDTQSPLWQLFSDYGFSPAEFDKMPVAWRAAIQESQPENTDFVIKVLRERVTHPM